MGEKRKNSLAIAILFILFTSISLISCGENLENDVNNHEDIGKEQEMSERTYSEIVKDFEKVRFNELDFSLKESFLVYIGFEECPYCQKFIPLLSEFTKKQNIKVYYIDSSEKDEELFKFSDEKGLETVPALIFYNGSDISSSSVKVPKGGRYTLEDVKEALSDLGYNAK